MDKNPSTPKFQVTADAGILFSGNNFMQAQCIYTAAVTRAPEKTVTLFHNGKIRSEHKVAS